MILDAGPVRPRRRPGHSARISVAGGGAALVVVVGLTVVAVGLRVGLLGQSVFADELSTYWVVSSNGLWGVVSTVHTDAEITPPLFFVVSWLATRVGVVSAEWLRLPSLVAGAAAVPLTYLLGLRTLGRAVGLVAAGLVALSPFMVFYSVEARGYELAIVLVLGSTLALLAAAERGWWGWWAVYAVCSCAAVYSHYTAVFALAGQLGWLWWAYPAARRAALVANAAAVAGFLPWLTGLVNDMNSPTTKILSQLEPFTLHDVGLSLGHATIGYPYSLVPLKELPGTLGVALAVLGVGLALVGLAVRWLGAGGFGWPGRGLWLVVVLVLATPVAEAVASAVGTNVFGTRNLAVAWPPFAVGLAALLWAAGRRLRYVAVGLVLAAFAIGAVRMLEPRFGRPDYDGAARFVDQSARPGDVVIDSTGVSPAPISAMDITLHRHHRLLYVRTSQIHYNPFAFLPAPSPKAVARQAAAAARGHRIVLITGPVLGQLVMRALPARFRPVERRSYPGFLGPSVVIYRDTASSGG